MLIVALTGGIGSGKTTISNIFKEKNIPVIDTDVIAKDIVAPDKPAYNQIVAKFGKEILNRDKTINRPLLRKQIFNNSAKRSQLENILHPIIWQEAKLIIDSLTKDYCIVVVPLLLENKSKIKEVKFDRILVVDVEEETQRTRSQKRDNVETTEINKIINSQVSRQIRIDAADDIIRNEDDISLLNKKVDDLHLKYLKLSK